MLARSGGMNPIRDRSLSFSGLSLFLLLTCTVAILGQGAAKSSKPKAKPAESDARAVEVPKGQVREVMARRSFFQEDFGTLAVLPKAASEAAAKKTGTFRVLQPYASCTVSATPRPVWFQFNHHLADSSGERRHLGALIIVHSKTVGSKTVEVYRNDGWIRQGSTEILGEFRKLLDLSWEEFAAISHKSGSADAKLQEVDDAFGGPWHAAPHGSDKYSWSYRKFWDRAASTYENSKKTVGSLAQADRFRVSARLLAYTPTPRLASDRPVIFSVNATQGDCIFLALYSLYNTGQDTWSWYWIQLQ